MILDNSRETAPIYIYILELHFFVGLKPDYPVMNLDNLDFGSISQQLDNLHTPSPRRKAYGGTVYYEYVVSI